VFEATRLLPLEAFTAWIGTINLLQLNRGPWNKAKHNLRSPSRQFSVSYYNKQHGVKHYYGIESL
jgi:hypothetical protein